MLIELVSQVELLENHIIPIKFATSANYEKKKKNDLKKEKFCNKAKGILNFTTI